MSDFGQNPKWIALARAAIVIGLVAFGFAAVASVYVSLQARDQSAFNTGLIRSAKAQSETNTKLLNKVQALSDRLIDCTTPDGKCYAQGSKRTAEAVVGINEGTLKVIVAALSCQSNRITQPPVDTQRDLLKCTIRLVRE